MAFLETASPGGCMQNVAFQYSRAIACHPGSGGTVASQPIESKRAADWKERRALIIKQYAAAGNISIASDLLDADGVSAGSLGSNIDEAGPSGEKDAHPFHFPSARVRWRSPTGARRAASVLEGRLPTRAYPQSTPAPHAASFATADGHSPTHRQRCLAA